MPRTRIVTELYRARRSPRRPARYTRTDVSSVTAPSAGVPRVDGRLGGCAVKSGLLWFDPDRRVSPQERLAEAASRFALRFGRPANCCHVHPDELFADAVIVVRPDPAVLKHHFWVGRDESLEPARRGRPRRARRVEPDPAPTSEPAAAGSRAAEPAAAEPVAATSVPVVAASPAAGPAERPTRRPAAGVVRPAATTPARPVRAASDALAVAAERVAEGASTGGRPRSATVAAPTPIRAAADTSPAAAPPPTPGAAQPVRMRRRAGGDGTGAEARDPVGVEPRRRSSARRSAQPAVDPAPAASRLVAPSPERPATPPGPSPSPPPQPRSRARRSASAEYPGASNVPSAPRAVPPAPGPIRTTKAAKSGPVSAVRAKARATPAPAMASPPVPEQRTARRGPRLPSGASAAPLATATAASARARKDAGSPAGRATASPGQSAASRSPAGRAAAPASPAPARPTPADPPVGPAAAAARSSSRPSTRRSSSARA